MEEFQWDDLNEHHARLKAGRDLADYINTCHKKCAEIFGEKPAFLLIGHSHGGNVILAGLGLLEDGITLAGIYLMGTPFVLYTEKLRRRKEEDGWEVDDSKYRNIYLSAPFNCPLRCYYASYGHEIDEGHTLFPSSN